MSELSSYSYYNMSAVGMSSCNLSMAVGSCNYCCNCTDTVAGKNSCNCRCSPCNLSLGNTCRSIHHCSNIASADCIGNYLSSCSNSCNCHCMTTARNTTIAGHYSSWSQKRKAGGKKGQQAEPRMSFS